MSAPIKNKAAKVRFKDMLSLARKVSKHHIPRVAVAGAHDRIVLDVLCDAHRQGFSIPILYGDETRIREIAARNRLSLSGCEIVDVASGVEASEQAVQAAGSGAADVLMKGNVTTATIIKAALDEDFGNKD